ncbi:hypothetical protein GGQ85_003809 [Nitrobacter vulgaris]|uniref:hypothetical protein n=1 Tax=Nitrobacter vulgaris TaxID=29421 RepID=UPI00285FC43C|nr:hypothetical protein [Nitrobacter vulgaris]MDR6306081.1 hypothetical protein [Nitrobacter vulgaris]
MDRAYFCCLSSIRATAKSFIYSGETLGYSRLRSSTTSTAVATTRRVNHLLSAGTTNQGKAFEAVARRAFYCLFGLFEGSFLPNLRRTRDEIVDTGHG